jgi:hypothetical protein
MKPPILCLLGEVSDEERRYPAIAILRPTRLLLSKDDNRTPTVKALMGGGSTASQRAGGEWEPKTEALDTVIPGAAKGFVTPSRRGSVALPRCRGCRREHQVKMRRLYLLGLDAFRRGVDIYVGD